MNEQSSAVVKAAWITAIVSCIGVTLAAVIGLGLPYVQKMVGLDESKTVIIVVTAPAQQPVVQLTSASQVEQRTVVVVVTATPLPLGQPATVQQVSGKWYWKQDPYWGYFYITQDGNSFSGTLDDVYEGTYKDRVINGKVDGSSIEFTRDGRYGIQYWRGTIIESNGTLEIQNGYWKKDGWTDWMIFYAKKVE